MDYLKITKSKDKESLFEYVIENDKHTSPIFECTNLDELIKNVLKSKNLNIKTTILKDDFDDFYLNELALCLESEEILYNLK